MSDLSSLFQQAVADSKTLSEKPDNETLLQLYSLYKQATEGDIASDPPGPFDFVARAKYDAWASLKGRSREEVTQEYISLVGRLKG